MAYEKPTGGKQRDEKKMQGGGKDKVHIEGWREEKRSGERGANRFFCISTLHSIERCNELNLQI